MNTSNIKLKIQRFKIKLDDWLLKKQIISGQDEYQKFIILTRARTGSNFLISLLQSNSAIRAFEELFPRQEKKINWGYANYPRSSKVLKMRAEKPLEFLDKFVFRQFPPSVVAVGFKLFYHQAQTPEKKAVWQYLVQNKNLKIIHLKRNNLLKVYLSHYLALNTNQWVLKNNQGSQNYEAVKLDDDDCLKMFEETTNWEQEYAQLFNEHPKIEIIYEELVANTTKESKRIQEFLGIKPQKLYSSTLKQNKGTLSSRIANYDELKEKFHNTPWRKFFDD